MKKAFVLFLAAVLVITLFAGCNSNSIKQALSGKEPESIASDAEGSSTELLGGWVKAESPEITDEFMKIFSKATETLTGVEYTPVAYIASQIVAGRNHCVLCKAKATVPDAESTYAIICIYEDLNSNASITTIRESNIPAADEGAGLPGGYARVSSPVISDELNEKIKGAFTEITGADYSPVAILESQTAFKDDANYCLLCEVTPVVPDATSDYKIVYVNVNDKGEARITDTKDFSASNENGVQIANPVVGYQTLEDAEKAVGFDITVPSDIKQVINYSVISGSILEIEFKGGYLRKAKGSEDISGDYNTYENSDTLNSGGKQYAIKGNGGKISLVTWADGGFTYCLSFENGADSNDVVKLLEGIK
ncbi:MAG: hypothetical protein Q3968_05350 [Clostridiaceae bacterium]|nr:hypothetical protein [Clostridiaceae bacterium]